VELEPDSKWALYTKVLILKSLDSQAHHQVKKKPLQAYTQSQAFELSFCMYQERGVVDLLPYILAWIWIRGSVPLGYRSGSGPLFTSVAFKMSTNIICFESTFTSFFKEVTK
jgi:hypothetical protein